MLVTNQFDWEGLVILDMLDQGGVEALRVKHCLGRLWLTLCVDV